MVTTNVDHLIDCVLYAFNEVSHEKLSDNFITLQSVMNSVIESNGSNDYGISHLRKQKARREGNEIQRVFCSSDLIRKGDKFLLENDNTKDKTE